MNVLEILALVFFYGMTVLGLSALPRALHRTAVMKVEDVSGIMFINLLFIAATIIVWANHDPHNILMLVVGVILVLVFAFQIIRVITYVGKTLVGSKRGVAIRAVELILCVVLISILAFA